MGLVPGPEFNDPHLTSVCFLEGPWTGDTGGRASNGPVSYTHLTLPTICSV